MSFNGIHAGHFPSVINPGERNLIVEILIAYLKASTRCVIHTQTQMVSFTLSHVGPCVIVTYV